MHITKARVTWKNHIGATFDLGPRTAITGPNWTGKTALLDGLRFSLGASNASPAAQNWDDGAHPSVLFQLDDETRIERVFREGKGLYTRTNDRFKPSPDNFPIASYAEIVTLGAAKGRAALYARFGQDGVQILPRGLDSDQVELWEELGAACDVSTLVQLSEACRAEIGRIGRVATPLDRQIEEGRDEDDSGAEDIGRLQTQLERLEADFRRTLSGLIEEDGAAQEALTKMRATVALLQRMAKAKKLLCEGCRGKIVMAATSRVQKAGKLAKEKHAIGVRRSNWANGDTREGQEVDKLQNRIAKLQKESGADTLGELTAKVKRMRRRQEDCKACQSEAVRLLNKAREDTVTEAEMVANLFMPESMTAGIIVPKKGSALAWGVQVDGGQLQPYKDAPQSARVALLVALAQAYAPAEDGPRFVFLDDLDIAGIAGKNVRSFLATLGKADIDQAIVVVDEDKAKWIPGDWAVINLE